MDEAKAAVAGRVIVLSPPVLQVKNPERSVTQLELDAEKQGGNTAPPQLPAAPPSRISPPLQATA